MGQWLRVGGGGGLGAMAMLVINESEFCFLVAVSRLQWVIGLWSNNLGGLNGVKNSGGGQGGGGLSGYAQGVAQGCSMGGVKQKYRRQGYGEALLRAAILKCQSRKIQRISLHVDPSRTAAVNLYEKHGFRIDSLVVKYYSADRDAYRMYLELSTSE
ncbi:putative ribosomal-protein-alanine acetyltransferase [Bienertia sinuspersici]